MPVTRRSRRRRRNARLRGYAALIAKAFAAYSDPADAVAAVFKAEAKILTELKFLERLPGRRGHAHAASTVEELREPCAEAFDLWIETFAGGLAATGLPAKDARALASYVLSLLEGAIVLSRAEKSVTALERTAAFDSVTAAVTFQTVTIRECRYG